MVDPVRRMLGGESEPMPDALSERYPELAGVALRRGGLPPRIAGWLLGQRSVAAITLWNTVFLGASEPVSPELLLHEARHVQQFGADWSFPVRYLLESVRRGYHRNRFEVDARAYANRRLRGENPSRGAP